MIWTLQITIKQHKRIRGHQLLCAGTVIPIQADREQQPQQPGQTSKKLEKRC